MADSTQRKHLGAILRRMADRINPEDAPRRLSASFTYEIGEGYRFRTDGKGCPLWYMTADDYRRGTTEADSYQAVKAEIAAHPDGPVGHLRDFIERRAAKHA